ncbi:hypothetical protein [Luteimonas sp. FCS-9]|uniref:hypothetical protein n=1 Tax=Luteimonas sp. FCS-9 TaxID=1547516 RepID=UPI00063E7EDB|nr:hypothetical protein [Luteimonas sp. FCS-9]KLJ02853.1 hypothetical protein WQ56_00805 [Luteimonas sp. FCS-9]
MTTADHTLIVALTALSLLAWISATAWGAIVFGDWLQARGVSMRVADRVEQITWALAVVGGVVVAVLVASA